MNQKKKIQDIIPPKTRTIREIAIPVRKKKDSEKIEHKKLSKKSAIEIKRLSEEEEVEMQEEYETETSSRSEKPRRFGIWILALTTIAVVIFIVFQTFNSSATVTVVPHSKDLALSNLRLIGSKNVEQGKVKYEMAEFKKEIKREIPATISSKVERKASGTIVIYNETGAPQTLIKSTRFESGNKNIYRIQSALTVPAAKKGADGKLVAGKIEALVIADGTGSQYNIGLSDFTIPGFKGDAKYTTIYARSKTVITGGAAGTEKTASEVDVQKVRGELKEELSKELFNELSIQKPENYILFPGATAVTFEDVVTVPASSSTVFVTERAVISGIMFDKSLLAKGIARALDPASVNEDIYIGNSDELVFLPQTASSTASIEPLSGKDVPFLLSGTARIIWNYNPDNFTHSLLGKEQSEIQSVLTTQFKNIDKATPEISPFWVRSFPSDSSKIKIIPAK